MPRSRKVVERKAVTGVMPKPRSRSRTRSRKSNSDHTAEELQAMIAEAAYFRAEQRNFAPGYEQHDWLEAEREIDAMLSNR